jgi:hypothetical protein
MARRNPAQQGQRDGIDNNNREARTPAARADKAWIEYYIQHKWAASILRLAFFSMDERQRSPENSGLEYHLVYRNGFLPRGGACGGGAERMG